MEFKAIKDEVGLSESAAEALKQIEDKHYDTDMKDRGIKEIVKYGIAFAGKNVEIAKADFQKSGAKLIITNDPVEAVKDADVIYTDTWVSMGMESEKAERIKLFADYQVDSKLASNAKSDYLFMHCLPAYRGYEVSEDVIDGPNSIIFDEAENRLHAQKAVMVTLMGDK